jgi:GAF domain-containing protein
MPQQLVSRLTEKIRNYGKENLEEMLFTAGEGLRLIAGTERIRIYLEDLTRGALSCSYASGPFAGEIREMTFPIISDTSLVSQVYMTGAPNGFTDSRNFTGNQDREFAERFSIIASYLLPLTHNGRTFGVVCVDRDRPGEIVTPQQGELLLEFSATVARNLDQARKYHQQLLLSRRVDESKKREAAALMVQSAVRLIEPLALASVLVPGSGPGGKGALEVLASHADDPGLKELYDRLGSIALHKGRSLIAEFVNDDAVITDELLLKPLYIPDLTRHTLQKKALT